MRKNEFKMGRMNKILEKVEDSYRPNRKTQPFLSVRDLLNITRKLNEEKEEKDENDGVDVSTKSDFEYEKSKAEKFLDGMGLRFTDENGKPYLKITNNKIIWGGVVNGIIRFVFIVEQDKNKSKVIFDYTEDFSPDNPENDEIIKAIESYYDSFYDRWIEKINK